MGAPAVVQATFEDFKLIKTRGVAQLIFEVPAETADAALYHLGGLPKVAVSVFVAIARLRPNQESTMDQDHQQAEELSGENAMKQCAIACKDEGFQRWVLASEFRAGEASGNNAMATASVRNEIGIKSRTEIRDDPEKRAEWGAMYKRFQATQAPAAA